MISKTEIMLVNKIARDCDDSHKWPVCGRFSVAERAIRKARKIRRDCPCTCKEEYLNLLDSLMTEIVNAEV